MSRYTPAELSYLLAGRESESAGFAREALSLAELHEGDAGVATGAQALVANGRAHVESGSVVLGDEAKIIGYVLGTARDWLRLSLQTENSDEGVGTVAMAFVAGAPGEPAVAARVLPLGIVEFGVVDPERTIADAAIALVEGYLGTYDTLAVAVQRDTGGVESSFGFARGQGEPLRVLHRRAVPGLDDLSGGEGEPVDTGVVVGQLRALVGTTS